MFLYALLLLTIIIAMFWLASFILRHAETVTITWGTWGSYSVESTNLLIAFIALFVVLYAIIWLIKALFCIKKNIQTYRYTRLRNKAKKELIQGLIQFASAHWSEAEVLLLRNINYAETPLLNYLAVARAAQMQQNYEQRDHYLKKASEKASNACIAVAVSQAEMQFSSQQIEQARATLVHLLELSPTHPYGMKLLAEVYYKQEDWKNLFSLLPEIKKQNVLEEAVLKRYERVALNGLFESATVKKQPEKLGLLWRQVSSKMKEKPLIILQYIDALTATGDVKQAEKVLLHSVNKKWDASLVERFGEIEHVSLNKSIQQAEKWMKKQDNSPELLMCLARLYRSNKLWGKSCYFYESSLNVAPDSKGYLEFAALLMELDDTENATLCYQQGLTYCVTKKGEALYLKSKNVADPSRAASIEDDVEQFYTI
jgi:HemY protein